MATIITVAAADPSVVDDGGGTHNQQQGQQIPLVFTTLKQRLRQDKQTFILTIGDSNDRDTLHHYCHAMNASVCWENQPKLFGSDIAGSAVFHEACNTTRLNDLLGRHEESKRRGTEVQTNYCVQPESGLVLGNVMHFAGAVLSQFDLSFRKDLLKAESPAPPMMSSSGQPSGPPHPMSSNACQQDCRTEAKKLAKLYLSLSTRWGPGFGSHPTEVEIGVNLLRRHLNGMMPHAVMVHAAFWDLNHAHHLKVLSKDEGAIASFLERYWAGTLAMMGAVKKLFSNETDILFIWRTANPCRTVGGVWEERCGLISAMNQQAREAAAIQGFEILDLELALRNRSLDSFLRDAMHYNAEWQYWVLHNVLRRLRQISTMD